MDAMYILKTFTSWYSIGLNQSAGPGANSSDADASSDDVFNDLKQYATGRINTELWIDRSTCQITESRMPLAEEEPLAETRVDAFLGIVEVMNTYHLGLVVKSEAAAELQMGELGLSGTKPSRIMMIKEAKFLPIQSELENLYVMNNANQDELVNPINSPNFGNLTNLANLSNLSNTMNLNAHASPEQIQLQLEVQKIIENMEKMLATGYYYSYDTDITNTLQNLYLNGHVPLSKLVAREPTNLVTEGEERMRRNEALYKASNYNFNWCHKITNNVPKSWTVVMIQGYVGYRVVNLSRDIVEFLLIGRRSIKRAGTRYMARGIDEEGNVGNFVDSELRMRVNGDRWYSFVQSRGSVPIFWEQQYFAAPVNIYNQHLNPRSFAKHMEFIKRLYRPCDNCLFVNLLDVKENEKALSDNYLEVVDWYNKSHGPAGDHSPLVELEERGDEPRDHVKIRVVNYNYNVNAKWNTHDVIINYIVENMNNQLKNIGYFDEHKYTTSARERKCSGNLNVTEGTVTQVKEADKELQNVTEKVKEVKGAWEQVKSQTVGTSGEKDDAALKDVKVKEVTTEGTKVEDKDKANVVKEGDTEDAANKEDESADGLQRGAIRTNCLDCLDRTNIFQWILGWMVFNNIMSNRKRNSPEEEDEEYDLERTMEESRHEEQKLFSNYTELWCNHGDYISIHYSGTPSTLSERVRQKDTNINSLLYYSKMMVQRVYCSIFQDYQRQTIFNILTPASYAYKEHQPAPREQEQPRDEHTGAEPRSLLSTKYQIEDVFDEGETKSSKEETAEERAEEPKPEEESVLDKLNNEINKLLGLKSTLLTKPAAIAESFKPKEELVKVLEEPGREHTEAEAMGQLAEHDLKVWVGSWNIGAHMIQVDENLLNWTELKKIECDIYIFSFQEFVELNFINIATGRRDENKEFEFENLVVNLFKFCTNERYYKLASTSMTGLYLVAFVKESLRPHIGGVMTTNVKTGMNYNIGNKGCVGIQFRLFDLNLSFLNVHLNFGKNLNVGRIELIDYILKNAFKDSARNVVDNDVLVIGGDFNFQIQLEKDVVLNLLKRREFGKLFNYDEFNMAKMIGIPILNRLYEPQIKFQPTYKYKDGTRYYTTKRAPAWCDRIIFGGRLFEANKIKVLNYKRNDNLIMSDHRPISSIMLLERV